MYDSEEIKNRVRRVLVKLRTENGLTQTDVGILVGKTKTAVAAWEQGLSMPDVATLYFLSKYYNKSMEYMYGEEDNNL